MRRLGYAIGLALLVIAASVLVAQILSLMAGTAAMPVSLASVWRGLGAGSLAGFQGLVEGAGGPMLWTPIHWLLTLPLWLPFGAVGILLLLQGRRRGRGGFD
jgi:hypothetical protein